MPAYNAERKLAGTYAYDRVIGKLVRMIANPSLANAEAKVNPFSSARPPL